jgi:alkylation response protein AidB-like acyl-CoA dehydrogenase
MYFGLSEEQLMIQDSFRRTFERSVNLDSIRAVSTSDSAKDHALWKEVTELGLPALLIDDQYGGANLTLMEAAVVAEEIGRHAAPVPFAGTAIMAPIALSLTGSDIQKDTWLPSLASGEKQIGIAFAEQISGARRNAGVIGTDNILSGTAYFVLDAIGADAFIVVDSNLQLFLVEANTAGLKVIVKPTIDGTRPLAELAFDNVPAETLPGSTPDIFSNIVNAGRIILSAESYGAADEMLRQAVAYAKERKQFDRVIGSFQAVKHMCAEMAAELQPVQSLIWYAAYAFDALPEEAPLSGLLAKSHMDDIGRFVARTATEVHGGMGYTDLMGLHFWFKRIGFNRAILGSPEQLRTEAAKLQGLAS